MQIGKLSFVTISKNDNARDSTGCIQCLRFRNYLTKKFFICIDSDLRLLRGEQDLDAAHLIGQTYAYSWENHHCEANNLQARLLQKVPDTTFDFIAFLGKLSKIVYEPLLKLVQCKNAPLSQQWNVKKFNACFPDIPKGADIVTDNGNAYLDEVKYNFNSALQGLPIAVTPINGLTPDNAYLHIQGHCLQAVVLRIGIKICSGKQVNFGNDILATATHTQGYQEVNNLQQDLSQIIQF